MQSTGNDHFLSLFVPWDVGGSPLTTCRSGEGERFTYDDFQLYMADYAKSSAHAQYLLEINERCEEGEVEVAVRPEMGLRSMLSHF
jgi:hypothetical protein